MREPRLAVRLASAQFSVDLRSPAAQFAGCLTGLAELVRALRLGERQHRGDLGAQFAGHDQVGDRDQREAVGLDEGDEVRSPRGVASSTTPAVGSNGDARQTRMPPRRSVSSERAA
jgi:hypothetical protein